MPDLSSLIAQPQAPQTPQMQQGTPGEAPASLQSLMGAPGGVPMAAPQKPPAPDYQQTASAVYHLSEFQRKYKKLLSDPEIGRKNMRPEMLEMMADVLGEGLATLPQIMSQVKDFPTEPLQQKQYLEKHYQQSKMAAMAILEHHAAAFPAKGVEPVPPVNVGGDDHHAVLNGMMGSHYGGRR
jgi:hypothetical protein